MFIRIGFEIVFESPGPTPMLLLLYTHPSRAATLARPERLSIEPAVPVQDFTDGFGPRDGTKRQQQECNEFLHGMTFAR